MTCPPVRGDNPQALASELSYEKVDKHAITFYTTFISAGLAHHEKLRASVGKSGLNVQHLNHRKFDLRLFEILAKSINFRDIVDSENAIYLQDGPGLCFCPEFVVSLWSSEKERA